MYGFAQSQLPCDLLVGCAGGAWSPCRCPACTEGISAHPGVEPFPLVLTAQGQARLLGCAKPPPSLTRERFFQAAAGAGVLWRYGHRPGRQGAVSGPCPCYVTPSRAGRRVAAHSSLVCQPVCPRWCQLRILPVVNQFLTSDAEPLLDPLISCPPTQDKTLCLVRLGGH